MKLLNPLSVAQLLVNMDGFVVVNDSNKSDEVAALNSKVSALELKTAHLERLIEEARIELQVYIPNALTSSQFLLGFRKGARKRHEKHSKNVPASNLPARCRVWSYATQFFHLR
jgi:hypothetical protein